MLRRIHHFIVLGLLSFAGAANASSIDYVVDLVYDDSQIYAGGYGAGYFWRPNLGVDPFTLASVGDRVSVTIRLSGGRLTAFNGDLDLESVGFGFESDSFAASPTVATWEFLDGDGGLLNSVLSDPVSYSEGRGIGANINPINLTDSAFSFSQVRIEFALRDDPRLAGFPATFFGGFAAVQTQGGFRFEPNATEVPEPTTLALLGLGLPLFAAGRIRSRWRQDRNSACPRAR